MIPPAPISDFAITFSKSSNLIPSEVRRISVPKVQFIVHNSGNQPFVELQNAAMWPLGSITGLSENANTVPELPRLMVALPGVTFPVPIAAIILSPPPVDTGVPSGIPYSIETSRFVTPMNSPTLANGGRYFSILISESTASKSLGDHFRLRTSSMPVPDASPYSITF